MWTLILTLALSAQADVIKPHAQEVHPSHVTREPFVPQTLDLGAAVGNAWSSSSYILLEGFLGLKILSCGTSCLVYLDAGEKIAAQRGQTHYISTLGPRFQFFSEGSSLGPYLRPFLGINHYIFSGTVQDFGVGGMAMGTYFYLHPAADLRVEASISAGPIFWAFISLGAVIKWSSL